MSASWSIPFVAALRPAAIVLSAAALDGERRALSRTIDEIRNVKGRMAEAWAGWAADAAQRKIDSHSLYGDTLVAVLVQTSQRLREAARLIELAQQQVAVDVSNARSDGCAADAASFIVLRHRTSSMGSVRRAGTAGRR